MNYTKISITAENVKSLCWEEDNLVDWVAGGHRYCLDGAIKRRNIYYAYRFDSAIISPTGRYSALYERLGTKAIILDNGKIVREINRSFYRAFQYDYPILFFLNSDGRELLAHCPDRYCKIEIEEIISGDRLTTRSSEPMDFFHSRLSVDPSCSFLMSSGWAWCPFDNVRVWHIDNVLKDPSLLDIWDRSLPDDHSVEINNACFLNQETILISSNIDAEDFYDDEEFDEPHRRPSTLSVFDIPSRSYKSIVPLGKNTGQMMPLGEKHVVCFYEHPRVYSIESGELILELPDINSGKRSGAIYFKNDMPVIALDSKNKRFAIADDEGITVVQFTDTE